MKRSLCRGLLAWPLLSLLLLSGECRQALGVPAGPTGEAAAPSPGSPRETGAPFFRYYSPQEHGGGVQNWDVVQDRRGVVFVANNDGILEFDGVRWRLIQTPNRNMVRSLAMDGAGRVYVGAVGEIGYLAPDSNGKMGFVSLADRARQAGVTLKTVVQRTFATPEGVYFQTNECLLLLGRNGVQVWRPSTSFHVSFLVNGRLFVRQTGLGLMELRKGKLALIPGGERFAVERVGFMLPWDGPEAVGAPEREGRILIGSRAQGLFLYDGAAITPLATEADPLLQTGLLSHAVWFGDGTLALATIQGGLLCLDREGRLLMQLDKRTGLATDTVYHLEKEGEHGLWLATEKGLVHVEWPSSMMLFDGRFGLEGSVIALCRHRGTLYVATSQGVYFLESFQRPGETVGSVRFQHVAGIKAQCWSFLPLGDRLLVANFKGVFEIRGDQADLVRLSDTPSLCLYRSRRDPSRLFVGLGNGLASIRMAGADPRFWIDEGEIPGIGEEIRTMAELADGRLWLGSAAQGALRIVFPPNWQGGQNSSPPQVERFGTMQGLPESIRNGVHFLGGKTIFSTDKGLYRFDETSRRFAPDPAFASLFPDGPRWTAWPCEDGAGRIWMDTVDDVRKLHETGFAFPGRNGVYRWECGPLLRIAGLVVWAIHAEENGVVWFGGPDGLIRYDSHRAQDCAQGHPAIIRLVEKAGGQPVFWGAENENASNVTLTLPYAENSLRFEFALPAFDHAEGNRYQVFLEGHDNEWTAWKTDTYKEYTNLPEGRYRFRVRGRNVYGQVGREAVYEFRVLAPWYRTWWAYGGFALLAVMLVGGGVRWRLQAIKRKNLILEALVKERTRDLAASNQALAEAAEALRNQSLTDSLTGLRNRRFLAVSLPEDVAQADRQHRNLREKREARMTLNIDIIFIMVDLDHFKNVNDEHGHAAGDLVLQQVGQLLRQATRGTDTVVRWGGEEFLVVARQSSRADAAVLAERIRSMVERHAFDIGEGKHLARTCSLGFCCYPFLPERPEDLPWEMVVDLADKCLYAAKRAGRNAWVGLTLARHYDAERIASSKPLPVEELIASGDLAVLTSLASSEPLDWRREK